MIFDYISKHPEIQVILITSIIIPCLVLYIKNVKQNVILSVKLQLANSLSVYDNKIDEIKLNLDTLINTEKTFHESIGRFVNEIDQEQRHLRDEQRSINSKLDNIEDLENQIAQKMHLIQFQYNSLEQKVQYGRHMRGQLNKDTYPEIADDR